MGSNQSRPSDAATNEKLLERLQAMHMKDERSMNEKDGFVVVDGEARTCSSSRESIFDSNMSRSPEVQFQHRVQARYLSDYSERMGGGAHERPQGKQHGLPSLHKLTSRRIAWP